MYREDSFFTLTIGGQIGLVTLSVLLAAIFLHICWRTTLGKFIWLRFAIAVFLFMSFVWLMPQIYYIYYIFLLDVPWQIVIQSPPTPVDLGRILLFAENANLSFHAQAVMGWALILLALLRPKFEKPKPAR